MNEGDAKFRMASDPATLPGKSEPDAAIFIGRDSELGVLCEKLDTAFAGRGSLAMLAGEAGVGKTFIAREFAGQARQRGALVLSGCCFEGDWQPPYGPWVEALGDYFRTGDGESLWQALGPAAASLAQLLPGIGALLPDTPAAVPLSPDEERVRLYDVLVQFLLVLAKESPVLLVLDDLHWADRDSLRLLLHLSRFVARSRLLVVGAYRDADLELNREHPLTDLLAMLHREATYHHVVVRGFTYEEVAEYLAHQAGQALPRAIVDVIYAQTNGNPFYVREVFRHLREERKILQRAGRWSTDLSMGELGIPEGIRRVVDRRIASLSADIGRLLRLAAGFGAGFTFPALQALMDRPEEVLLSCLDEALATALVRVVDSAPPRYDFAHAIVRHTLYDGLNPDRRARLHRRIVDALERVYAPHQMKHAAEIAAQYHASAGLPGAVKGVPYALAAAAEASAGYAHERRASYLRMARDLSVESEPAARADILCNLAVTEAEALLLAEARQTVEEALAALAAAGAGAQAQAAFLARVSRALKDGGASTILWEPLVERGLLLCGEERNLVWARLTLLRGRLEPLSSSGIGAAQWLGHDALAVSIARSSGDEDDYARTLEALDWRTSEETSTALALVRTWRRPTAIMRALGVLGRDLMKRHDTYREATGLYHVLLATSEQCGSIAGQGEALVQLAIMQAVHGELSVAQQTARRAQEMVTRLGPAHELHFQERGLAATLAYFLECDWPAFAAGASRFAAALGGAQNPRAHLALACAALAHARAGSTREAHELLAALTLVVARLEPTIYVHQVVVLFAATAVWEIGAVEFAETYRRLARDILEAGFGSNVLTPEVTISRMAALRGDIVEAHEYFTRARALQDAGGLLPARAIADYDEALALLRTGSIEHARVRMLLEVSLAAFRALGMEGWAKRALDLEEQLATARVSAPPNRRAHLDGLTRREIDVLRLLAGGSTNKEIAEALVLSTGTVEQHIVRIYGKIGARGRADATAYAFRHDLIRPRIG